VTKIKSLRQARRKSLTPSRRKPRNHRLTDEPLTGGASQISTPRSGFVHALPAVMNGMPLMIVARNLGHRDTRMCELHYAHLPPGHVRDAIHEGAPKFGFKPDSKVALLRG
jgi:hypothetical protein